jgi:hypothetical protein
MVFDVVEDRIHPNRRRAEGALIALEAQDQWNRDRSAPLKAVQ